MKVLAWICAIALSAAALVIHFFYVDYTYSARNYLFSWGAYSQEDIRKHADKAATLASSVDRSYTRCSPTPHEINLMRWAYKRENCEYIRGPRKSALEFDRDNDYRCDVAFEPPPIKCTRVNRDISYQDAYRAAEIELEGQRFGAAPRTNDQSHERTFWIGILLPFVLVLLSSLATAAALRGSPNAVDRKSSRADAEQPSAGDSKSSKPRPKQVFLAEAVRDHLGDDFPAPSGNGSRSDPLVISATKNYVKYEYEAARVAMKLLGLDYKSEGNRLHSPQGGRYIDELVFSVKPHGAEEWTDKRSLFFDITAGFQALG